MRFAAHLSTPVASPWRAVCHWTGRNSTRLMACSSSDFLKWLCSSFSETLRKSSTGSKRCRVSIKVSTDRITGGDAAHRTQSCSWTWGRKPGRCHGPWTPDDPQWEARLKQNKSFSAELMLVPPFWFAARQSTIRHFVVVIINPSLHHPRPRLPVLSGTPLVWVGRRLELNYDLGEQTERPNRVCLVICYWGRFGLTFGLCMTIVSPDGNSSLRCHWFVDTAFLYSACRWKMYSWSHSLRIDYLLL